MNNFETIHDGSSTPKIYAAISARDLLHGSFQRRTRLPTAFAPYKECSVACRGSPKLENRASG